MSKLQLTRMYDLFTSFGSFTIAIEQKLPKEKWVECSACGHPIGHVYTLRSDSGSLDVGIRCCEKFLHADPQEIAKILVARRAVIGSVSIGNFQTAVREYQKKLGDKIREFKERKKADGQQKKLLIQRLPDLGMCVARKQLKKLLSTWSLGEVSMWLSSELFKDKVERTKLSYVNPPSRLPLLKIGEVHTFFSLLGPFDKTDYYGFRRLFVRTDQGFFYTTSKRIIENLTGEGAGLPVTARVCGKILPDGRKLMWLEELKS